MTNTWLSCATASSTTLTSAEAKAPRACVAEAQVLSGPIPPSRPTTRLRVPFESGPLRTASWSTLVGGSLRKSWRSTAKPLDSWSGRGRPRQQGVAGRRKALALHNLPAAAERVCSWPRPPTTGPPGRTAADPVVGSEPRRQHWHRASAHCCLTDNFGSSVGGLRAATRGLALA